MQLAYQPDLADAALDLVRGRVLGLAERLEFLSEFDHIAIAILPFVEEFEIVHEILNAHALLSVSGRMCSGQCKFGRVATRFSAQEIANET